MQIFTCIKRNKENFSYYSFEFSKQNSIDRFLQLNDSIKIQMKTAFDNFIQLQQYFQYVWVFDFIHILN